MKRLRDPLRKRNKDTTIFASVIRLMNDFAKRSQVLRVQLCVLFLGLCSRNVHVTFHSTCSL